MSKARDLANAGTALGAVSATELAFVDGVTSAIQTQIDAKAPSSTAVTLTGTQTLTNKTLTNPVIASVVNNTLIDAKGDIITATAADTPARLAVGANGTVLTAASGQATGLQWATPAAGGMTLISTTTLTGSSISLTSIPQTYNNLYVVIRNSRPVQDNVGIYMRVNNDSGTKYKAITSPYSSASGTANSNEFYPAETNNDSGVSDGLTTMLINDYTNTATYKVIEAVVIKNNNTTLANIDFNLKYCIFFSSTAITEINLFTEGVSGWNSGTVLLYGVK
jgi:hypothetical protein